MHRIQFVFLAAATLALGCVGPGLQSRRDSAAPAIAALQRGRFDDAERLAREGASLDSENPYALLVAALARYKRTNHQLVLDGRTVLIGGLETGAINQKYLQSAMKEAESELAKVEENLAIVARSPEISMELCLACWEIDWNGNGRIDDRDRLLFQIEQDERGEPIPEGDPRRTPTFRFDHGDIAWARAFVSFERAALDVLLAYDFSDLARVIRFDGEDGPKIVLRLIAPERIAEAKKRILEGLDQSEASRQAYLAETDDDREWVPNPKQKNHPMPLPVDAALYATWEGVVGDVRRLVEGEEGLWVADLLTLAEETPETPPKGFLDVGRMLSHPKDIVLDLEEIDRLEDAQDVDGALSAALGEYHVPSMKASPLPRRLLRMKGEIDKGDEALERKLRYLLWLN